MHRIDISHVFACTPKEYLQVIDSAEFHERLRERLHLRERRLLERREDPEAIHVRWYVAPERELPAPVRSFLGGKGTSYIEEEDQPRSRPLHREWRIALDALDAKRFRCQGTFDLHPEENGGVRREVRGEVEVRIFGVGGFVERAIVKATEESYEKTTALVNEMLAERRRTT
jgi:hypothetical protein